MDKLALARRWGAGGRSGHDPFRLGDVEVSPDTGSITGPGGTRQLDPRVMQVLLRLVAAGGDLVSREELMADVWRGTVVTDFALSRCVYQLRKNLRRVSRSPNSPVETLPKRGYRLAWSLAGTAAPAARPLHNRHAVLPLAAAVLVVAGVALTWWYRTTAQAPTPGRTAVAVLPFQDLTEDGDLGYFGDGVATALMVDLGRLTEVDVIARTSSFQFRDHNADASQIAAALNVDYLVEGSVNSQSEAIQVTAALVDATNGRQVWSGTFDGVAGQSFTAEQDIADAIAGYLEISLGDPRRHGGTTKLEAYDAYLRAFDTLNLVSDDGSGALFLDQALAYDPDFAQALEAKAFLIYLRLWQGDGLVEQAWTEARPYLERALEINDRSSFAYGTMAGFQIFRQDYETAEPLLRRALEINPSDTWALVHLSRLMEHTGRLEESVRLARHTVRLDPLNPFRHLQLANRLWTAGLFEEAEASFEQTLDLDPLNYAGWRDYCLRLSNRDGELAGFRLLARLQKNPEFRAQFTGSMPKLAPRGVELLALWFRQIGDIDRATQLLEFQSRLGHSAQLYRELGWSYLDRGETDRAWEEAWLALDGDPRDDFANYLAAAIALRTGQGIDVALEHFHQYWPGLFATPPTIDEGDGKLAMSAALLDRASGDETRAQALLDALASSNDVYPSIRAMALAHSGDVPSALDELETHVENGGFFDYRPESAFWAPLAEEPRFRDIVEREAERDAHARSQVALMIDRSELALPGID